MSDYAIILPQHCDFPRQGQRPASVRRPQTRGLQYRYSPPDLGIPCAYKTRMSPPLLHRPCTAKTGPSKSRVNMSSPFEDSIVDYFGEDSTFDCLAGSNSDLLPVNDHTASHAASATMSQQASETQSLPSAAYVAGRWRACHRPCSISSRIWPRPLARPALRQPGGYRRSLHLDRGRNDPRASDQRAGRPRGPSVVHRHRGQSLRL